MRIALVLVALILLASLLNVSALESSEGQKQARQAICMILSNIRDLLVYLTIGVGFVVYFPCIVAALIIFLVLKEDKPSIKLAKKIVKVLLVAVPVLILFVIAAILLVVWVFSGGQC